MIISFGQVHVQAGIGIKLTIVGADWIVRLIIYAVRDAQNGDQMVRWSIIIRRAP